MKKLTALLLIVCICLCFTGCGKGDSKNPGNRTEPKAVEVAPGKVKVDGCIIEITDYQIGSYTGGTAGYVFIDFTNNSGKSCSLNDVVKIRVYQNGVECREASMYEFSILAQDPFEVDDHDDILPGVTAKTGEIFKIQSYDKPVLVQIVVNGETVSDVTFDLMKK